MNEIIDGLNALEEVNIFSRNLRKLKPDRSAKDDKAKD
jgi:hypothetical protein